MRVSMTITMDYELKAKLKKLSGRTGTPISQYIENAIKKDTEIIKLLSDIENYDRR